MEQNIPNNSRFNPIRVLASWIVRLRFLILLAFLAAAVYCGLSIGKVKINSDITAYLPPQTETAQGLSLMEEEFVTYASANFMVSNIPYQRAVEMSAQIAQVPGVFSVTFDNTPRHYHDSAALFSVGFEGFETDEATVNAFHAILDIAKDYDTYTYTTIAFDYIGGLTKEMVSVVLIMAVVIVLVLLFTSRSYFEVFIFLIVFVFSAVLNMGTNYWLGTISALTNAIAVILQLALAIDYAVIFSHRYQDAQTAFPTAKEALVDALSHAIVEIFSSSLTTVSGLVALTLMQFRLGYDLGVVLSKGIICSMLVVFLLMPGLLLFFRRPLERLQHKPLVPSIKGWGQFLMHSRSCFVAVFAILIVPAYLFYSSVDYSFSTNTVDDITYCDRRAQMRKMDEVFPRQYTIAVLVPEGDFDKENALLLDVSKLDGVTEVQALATYEVAPGHYLTDRCTPRMFADLMNIDSDQATLLYMAYGVEHGEYQAIFGSTANYEVPLVNVALYLFEKIDQGILNLDARTLERVNAMRGTLERSIAQVRGEQWDRLVLSVQVPPEGEDSYALVNHIHDLADEYYGKGKVLVLGDITSAQDLETSFTSDSFKINLLTVLFVFVILLFTFRTLVGSLALVGVIQASIWLNFACLQLTGLHSFFITYTIVSALQMGATIDYAIVLMSRYQDLRKQMDKKAAMVQALSDAFPTVLTSGTILSAAGLLIAYRVTDVYVAHVGLCIGRGSIISILLVMTVLPQLIVLLDKAIEKTSFELHIQWIDKDCVK